MILTYKFDSKLYNFLIYFFHYLLCYEYNTGTESKDNCAMKRLRCHKL